MRQYTNISPYYFKIQQNIRGLTEIDKEHMKTMAPLPPLSVRDFFADFGKGPENVGGIESSCANYFLDFLKTPGNDPKSFRAAYEASGMINAGSFANALDILAENLLAVQPVRIDLMILSHLSKESAGLTYTWADGILKLDDPNHVRYRDIPEDHKEYSMFRRRIERIGQGSGQLYLLDMNPEQKQQ